MHRSGHTAATMFAVLAPQSQPAMVARSMPSASIRAITSIPRAAGCALRAAYLLERKRVVP